MKGGNVYSAFYKNNLKEAHISFSGSPNLFTIYYATKLGIFQALSANSGSTLPSFLEFFLKNSSSKMGASTPYHGHGSTESIPKY